MSKIYHRKTQSGHRVLARNFVDLDEQGLCEVVQVFNTANAIQDKFETLVDKLSDVREYARRNPTTCPQGVLDLIEDLSNH